MPVHTRELPEGITNQPTLPNGGVQGKNSFNQLGFGGPCPPNGTHRYFFKLFALDQPLELAPGATKADVMKVIEGHVLDASKVLIGRRFPPIRLLAELMGRYAREI